MINNLNKAINKVQIFKHTIHSIDELEDHVSIEEPLEISIQTKKAPHKKNISITMRTPGDDSELAVGFLYTEAIITKPQSIERIEAVSYTHLTLPTICSV